MSSIFLNHVDVRNLISGLGKMRPVSEVWQSSVEIVAKSLGMQSGWLTNCVWFGKPESPVGINLSKDAFIGLIAAMKNSDTTAMRNTERLELIAGLLSWKPDAMMNHLKRTTARLGSNDTIINPRSISASIDHLGLGELSTEKWRSITRSRTGINIVSGRVDSGKSTTMQRTLSEFIHGDRRPTLIVADKEPLQTVLGAIRKAETPIVVFTRELRHRYEFELAREAAKEAPVFMIAWADSAAATYARIVNDIGTESKSLVNGVLHQLLLRRKCVFCGRFAPECACGAESSRFAVAECFTGDEIENSTGHGRLADLIGSLVVEGKALREDADDHFGISRDDASDIMRPGMRHPGTVSSQLKRR
jgi:hypothetical protein